MLHHVSVGVTDVARAAKFYDEILAPLGYVRVWTNSKGVGFGKAGAGDKLALFAKPQQATPPGPGFHLAFDAPSRAAVDAFHAAALNAGGAKGAAGSFSSGLAVGKAAVTFQDGVSGAADFVEE